MAVSWRAIPPGRPQMADVRGLQGLPQNDAAAALCQACGHVGDDTDRVGRMLDHLKAGNQIELAGGSGGRGERVVILDIGEPEFRHAFRRQAGSRTVVKNSKILVAPQPAREKFGYADGAMSRIIGIDPPVVLIIDETGKVPVCPVVEKWREQEATFVATIPSDFNAAQTKRMPGCAFLEIRRIQEGRLGSANLARRPGSGKIGLNQGTKERQSPLKLVIHRELPLSRRRGVNDPPSERAAPAPSGRSQ